MALKAQSFEGGAPGATIATSDVGGGDALSEVIAAGAGTGVYSVANAAKGTKSLLLTSAATSDQFIVGYTGYSATALAFSFDMRPSSFPTAVVDFVTVRNTANAAKLQFDSAGKIRVTNASGTVLYTFTAAVAIGTWHRVEGVITKGTTTSDGRIQVKLFNQDSRVATESYDSGATVNAGTTNLQTVRVGIYTSTSTAWAWALDNLQVQDTSSFVGMVASSPVRPASTTTAGTYTAVGGAGSLHASLADASDATYAESGSLSASPVAFKVALPKLSAGNPVIRVRAAGSAVGVALSVKLIQGASTVIATMTQADIGTNPTEYVYSLTGGQAASITDWGDLSLEFSGTA